MKSLTKRLLTAAVAIPLLILIIVFLPHQHNLAFFIIILFADFVGTFEMKNIISKKGDVSSVGYLGVLLPIVQYLQLYFSSGINFVLYIFAILIGLAAAIEVFQGAKDNFNDSLGRIARTVMVVTYPSIFATFLVRLCYLENASGIILLFLALVFGTDSFAYFFGIAFGKNNKGFVKVSPNKSVAGFIGGILVPSIAGLLAPIIFPNTFLYTPVAGFVIGFATAVFSCIGDLIESCFKRSAGIKDSGTIIPGRGGMLDSIDSIIIAAPFYFVLTELFLGF